MPAVQRQLVLFAMASALLLAAIVAGYQVTTWFGLFAPGPRIRTACIASAVLMVGHKRRQPA